MKKNIIYSAIFILTLAVITACGTNSKENPPAPAGPYSFFDATTPLKVTKPSADINGTVIGGDYNLSVRLLEFDLAKQGESIQMRPFASAYGFVTETIVTTDGSGTATFIYNPPTGSDYDAVRGQDITIQAVYLDSTAEVGTTTTTGTTAPDILLTQDFVLQFR